MNAVLVPHALIENIHSISSGALRTYCILVILKRRKVSITQSLIAEEMKTSLRTVMRHLRELEELGYIRRLKGQGKMVDYEFTASGLWSI